MMASRFVIVKVIKLFDKLLVCLPFYTLTSIVIRTLIRVPLLLPPLVRH